VASWHHNLVIGFSSLSFSMALEVWFFMANLKRDVYKPKLSPKSGSKTHEPNVPSMCTIMSFDQTQISCQNGFTLVITSIVNKWP